MLKKSTEAKCDGATLTVSFHNAAPPLIWRFDLERNHSFTLALQGEDGEWELGITSLKGEFYPVARFDSEEDAREAFARTGRALAARGKGAGLSVGRALKFLALAVLAVILGVAIFVFAMSRATVPTGAGPAARMGVPLSADDILVAPK